MEESNILKIISREMESGVLVLNEEGNIIYKNAFFDKAFRLKKDVIGKKVTQVIEDKDLKEAIENCYKDTIDLEENIYLDLTRAGNVYKARLVATGSKEKNNFNLILFIRDITEEKRLEDIKRDFVANVSHELRTPLASIKGYSETLIDGAMDDKKVSKNFLNIIDKQATRMARLIDDLLILSRIESEPFKVETKSLDIATLAKSTVSSLNKHAIDKKIDLQLTIENNLPKVHGDEDRLEQVFVNLIENAIKYTPEEGKVFINIYKKDENVVTTVKDTGLGIPKVDLPRIFERFYRVDKARSREMGGTGLGLAIVKHIIQGHGGDIKVESEMGKGTEFLFTLKAV